MKDVNACGQLSPRRSETDGLNWHNMLAQVGRCLTRRPLMATYDEPGSVFLLDLDFDTACLVSVVLVPAASEDLAARAIRSGSSCTQ